jgi:hypothetical protein
MCEPDRIPDPPWFLRPRPVGARPYPDDMSTARLPTVADAAAADDLPS